MQGEKPLVFISYTNNEKDGRVAVDHGVALKVVDVLQEIGYDVWHFEDERLGGTNWRLNYRRQIELCQLFVPIVSKLYLSKSECRKEMELVIDRLGEDPPSVVPMPLIIDEIKTQGLDPDIRGLYRDLIKPNVGQDWRHEPSEEEIRHFCTVVVPKSEQLASVLAMAVPAVEQSEDGIALSGRHIDDATEPVQESTTDTPPMKHGGEPATPFTETWSRDGSRVTLTLSPNEPGARAVQRWFQRNRINSPNGRSWTVDRNRYETAIRDSLKSVVAETLKERNRA